MPFYSFKSRRESIMRVVILVLVFAMPICVTCRMGPQKGLEACVEDKVENLLRQMTLEEKVGQLNQIYWNGEDEGEIETFDKRVKDGEIGSFLGFAFSVDERNRLQRIAVEQSRLGIPLIFGMDVIHGYRTIFPIPLAMSCTWEPELVEKAASIGALEASSMGIDWTFAPMIDVARDPRWGRIAEGFGEEPYLVSRFAAASVRGFQGRCFSEPSRIVACLKHYVGYGAGEGGRDYNTCEISERTLREVYLPPFKAGVKAGAGTVMSAFNEISGIPASANRHTLTDILRGEWKFDGYVVSDWGAIAELVTHGVADSNADAAHKAITSGVDMDMMGKIYISRLPQLVREGKLSEEIVDEAVRRVLRIKYRAGLFSQPYIDAEVCKSVVLTNENLQIAREVARRAAVLVKNEKSLLPLKKDIKSLAVIGPLADSQKDLLGTWAAVGRAEDVVTILAGIRNKVSPACKLSYAKGCEVRGTSVEGFDEAVEAAQNADAVILVVGESEDMSGEAYCRSSLELPGSQQKLVETIHSVGKPVVVVLVAGRPLSVSWIKENIPAILLGWHSGVEGGNAIADCLFGDYNPSGKLSVTIPRTVGQVPIYYNHKNTGRPAKEDARYTSKYIDVPWTPLFEFGYGLSYTTFEYSNLSLSASEISASGSLVVTADVTNTGSRSGEEVVQLYIRDSVASATRPVKQLGGFDKIYLEAGQTKRISFTVTSADLAFYDSNMNYVVEPGEFKVWVGPNCREGLEGSFKVVADRAKL